MNMKWALALCKDPIITFDVMQQEKKNFTLINNELAIFVKKLY